MLPAWDGVGASMSEAALTQMLAHVKAQRDELVTSNKEFHTKANEDRKQLLTVLNQRTEFEMWNELMQINCKFMKKHIAASDAARIHLLLCNKDSMFSANAISDGLIRKICCRSGEQVMLMNGEFYILYDRELVNHSISCVCLLYCSVPV